MRTILIDLSGIYWQKWHAHARDGLEVPAARTRERVAELAEGYDDVILCLDHGSWRYGLFPGYKANRPPKDESALAEFDRVKADLATRYRCASAAGYEADDVLATLARTIGGDITIASGDKDLLQLVGPGVRVLSTITGAVYERGEDVAAKIGVLPWQLADFLAIAGDASDGIPGVPGIGAKGAAALLAEGRSMADIAAALDARAEGLPPWLSEKAADKIAASWDALQTYRRITALASDAPVTITEPGATVLEQQLRASLAEAAPPSSRPQRVMPRVTLPSPAPAPPEPQITTRGTMFKKATKKAAKLRLGLAGPSGSGKTFSALRIAAGLGTRIALVDTERGSASKYAGDPGIPDFDAADVAPPYKPETLIEILGSVSEYDVVIVDSLSHFWNGSGGFLEMVDAEVARMKSRGGRPDSFAAWKTVDPVYRRLLEAIVSCPAHVICCLRAKTAYEKVENDRGKTEIKRMGMAPEIRDGFEYEVDAFCMIDVEHRLVVQKTRCSEIDGAIVDKPGAPFAEPLLRWLGAQHPGDLVEREMVSRIGAALSVAELEATRDAIRADQMMTQRHRDRLRQAYDGKLAELRTN